MSNKPTKTIFFIVYLSSFLIVPISIFTNTPVDTINANSIIFVNFLQRLFGLLAFVALFYQIILGAYLTKIAEKLGSWIFDLHIVQGLLIYSTVLLHPLLYAAFNYYAGKGADPIYVFLQVCLLCQNRGEFFYTLGRVSFWLTTLTVFVGYFRTFNPFLRANWKKFHVLNYLVFIFVSLHGFFVGSDFSLQPFLSFVVISNLIVFYILIFKKVPQFILEFTKWIKKD